MIQRSEMKFVTFTKKYENNFDEFNKLYLDWITKKNQELNPNLYLEESDEDLYWDDLYDQWRGEFYVTYSSKQMNINNFLRNHTDFFDSVYCEVNPKE